MKRAGQDELENEQNSENSNYSEEESDEHDVPNSSLAPSPGPNVSAAPRTTGTGGKQPVSASSGGKPPPPAPARTTGTGGKQPLSASSIAQQRNAAVEKSKKSANNSTANSNAANSAGTGSSPASIGGKNPGVYAKGSQNATTQRQQNTPAARTGTGGKEPVGTHLKQVRHQPASKMSSQHSSSKARPQTQRKQHHLIGKMVKVFYVPEGYFTGVVKAQIGESEFMIHWDDGSTTSAILREEDETEDAENEDRWSIVEDIPYETIVPVNNDKAGNGARSKQITQQKPTPPPQPPQPAAQPAAFEEEEDDNGHENEDNENDENDDNDNYET
jgi:hypothetical protein